MSISIHCFSQYQGEWRRAIAAVRMLSGHLVAKCSRYITFGLKHSIHGVLEIVHVAGQKLLNQIGNLLAICASERSTPLINVLHLQLKINLNWLLQK